MRIVVQRVSRARVEVGGEEIARIGPGLLLLVGVGEKDGDEEVRWMADKMVGLRVFPDEEGKLNRSVIETRGDVLAVSQFTLYGDCRKGRRPSFTGAAPPEAAARLFQEFVAALRARGVAVQEGRFQARMKVELVNDGPVTLVVEKEKAV